MKIIIATKNDDKVREIESALQGLNLELIKQCDNIETEETATTFEGNAMLKARDVFERCQVSSLADDSGLEVDFLDGAPGVYSKRFAGENATDNDRNQKLLKLLQDVPFEKRTARFVSAIACILSNGEEIVVRGECEGHIIYEPQGENGFGYDPVFQPIGYNETFAQLLLEEKNKISHRARALKSFYGELCERLRI